MKREIKVTISSFARAVKVRREKTGFAQSGMGFEFESAPLGGVNHPPVAQSIVDAIYRIDPDFAIEWELQADGQYRWHIKKHRTASRSDEPLSVYVVQHPEFVSVFESGAYRPLDMRVVKKLEFIAYWNQSPKKKVEFVKRCQMQKQLIEQQRDKEDQQNSIDFLNETRRLAARLAWASGHSSSDVGWERGIGFTPDGTPFVDGEGALSRKLTKAI